MVKKTRKTGVKGGTTYNQRTIRKKTLSKLKRYKIRRK